MDLGSSRSGGTDGAETRRRGPQAHYVAESCSEFRGAEVNKEKTQSWLVRGDEVQVTEAVFKPGGVFPVLIR